MQSRISRGTPAMLSKDQQEAFVAILDQNPQLRDDVETLLGIKLDTLTKQERIAALGRFQMAGFSLAVMNAAHRAHADLHNAAEMVRGEIGAQDRLVLVSAERDEFARRNDLLTEQVAAMRDERVRIKAQPAAAVHSKGSRR